jgi:hypothetical protein
MATEVQWRGGTTAEHSSFTGGAREITIDTTKKTVVVHDGATAGGFPLLRQDLSNISLATNTLVTNLNANYLQGNTWAVPGAIGTTTPASGAFTTLSASGAATFAGNINAQASGSTKIRMYGAGLDGYIDNAASGGTINIRTSDASALNLGANGATVVAITTTGAAVTGALSATNIITTISANDIYGRFTRNGTDSIQLGVQATGGAYIGAGGSLSFRAGGYLTNASDKMVLSTAGLDVTGQSVAIKNTIDGDQFVAKGATNQNYQLRIGFDTTNLVGRIQAIHVGTAYKDLWLQPDGGNVLVGSLLLAGTTAGIGSTAHNFWSSAANTNTAAFQNTNASTPYGIYIKYSAAAPNGTVNAFIDCQDNSTLRFAVRSNGGIANYSANNANLSDARLKTDWQDVDLDRYYNGFQVLPIGTYLYNDQTDEYRNLGTYAQYLNEVFPELVDKDGFGETPEGEEPYMSIWQTDFQFATAAALKRAISEIESLKSQVAAMQGAQNG